MDFDDQLKKSGSDRGIFQWLMFFFLSFACFLSGVELSSMILTLSIPKFECDTKFNNVSGNNQSNYICAVPKLAGNNTLSSTPEMVPCTKWLYSRDLLKISVITEFDLVCHRSYLISLIYMVYFGGMLVGMAFNSVGDIIGRQRTLQILCISEIVINICLALVPGLAGQFVFRFLRGCCTAIYMQALALLTELVPIRRRGMFCIIFWICFPIGMIAGSGISYLGQAWRTIKWISLAPSVIYIFYFIIVPESPRWLVLRGKYDDAEKVYQKMAWWNGVKEKRTYITAKMRATATLVEETSDKRNLFTQMKRLFSHPNMRNKTLTVIISQWSLSFVYYGLTTDTTFVHANMFISVALQGLIETPTAIISSFFCIKLGRRLTLLIVCIILSVGLITVPLLRHIANLYTIASIIALISKMMTGIAFTAIDLQLAEIQPTETRLLGINLGKLGSSAANMMASFVNRLTVFGFYVPTIIYCVQLVVTFILTFAFIPETGKCPLVQTLTQTEQLYARHEKEWIKAMTEEIKDYQTDAEEPEKSPLTLTIQDQSE